MQYTVLQTPKFLKWKQSIRDEYLNDTIDARIEAIKVLGDFGYHKKVSGTNNLFELKFDNGIRIY